MFTKTQLLSSTNNTIYTVITVGTVGTVLPGCEEIFFNIESLTKLQNANEE